MTKAPRPSPEAHPICRDEAVYAFALAITNEDGLRCGLDALVRLLDDRSAAMADLPVSVRRDIAQRIVDALGFSLA